MLARIRERTPLKRIAQTLPVLVFAAAVAFMPLANGAGTAEAAGDAGHDGAGCSGGYF